MSEVWNEKGVKPIFYFKITGFLWKPKHDTLSSQARKRVWKQDGQRKKIESKLDESVERNRV